MAVQVGFEMVPYRVSISRFRLTAVTQKPIKMPIYKGSTFRGVLGKFLKKLSCQTSLTDCGVCRAKRGCAYLFLFDCSSDVRGVAVDHRNLSSPFVIIPPLDREVFYPEGHLFSFEVVLLGRATEYLPYLIVSFDRGFMRLGSGEGSAALVAVDQVIKMKAKKDNSISINDTGEMLLPVWRSGLGKKTILADPVTEELSDYTFFKQSMPGCMKDSYIDSNQIHESINSGDKVALEVNFHTPLRLMERGSLLKSITFCSFMRAVYRRLDILGRAYGSGPLNLPFKMLIESAEKVKPVSANLREYLWERFSNRQNQHIKMDGIIGQVVFRDVPQFFLPHVYMASQVNIGKATVMGMGGFTAKTYYGCQENTSEVV